MGPGNHGLIVRLSGKVTFRETTVNRNHVLDGVHIPEAVGRGNLGVGIAAEGSFNTPGFRLLVSH